MNKSVKKIVLILTLIILLPALLFTAFEINSLNESEETIKEIYTNQLEAILFSVNQYSEDMVSSWRSALNTMVNDETALQNLSSRADSFLNINKSIQLIFFADSINPVTVSGISLFNNYFDPVKILSQNSDKISRLHSYQQAGYYKIEPLKNDDSSTVLITLLNDPHKKKNICGIIINSRQFIREVLSQKLKSISGEEFNITCTNKKNNELIYSVFNLDGQEIKLKKDLWLLPDYELGILLRGTSIESIISGRTTTNLLLISLLTLILIAGVFVVFRNIRREVELAQIKSDFVSNVSHELRTPLALISMFAETLEMGRARTEEKKQEYYSIISSEASRLSRIVNKILSFSKIEAGRREYNVAAVDLNSVVEEVFSTYQFHLQNNGFVFSLNMNEKIPEIKADSEAISEALINLIDNAVKYSRDKKEIHISTGFENTRAFVEVKDCGIGISEENQKKIFDKFYRVSEGLVHSTKGTGLGLTLVKHIMEAHQGEVTVKSKNGEGSRFRLVFPAFK